MFKIAIVEDQEETRESLNRFVRQYAQEQGLQVEISLITDGAEIAEHYTPGFDIIFMDVEMPRLDGFGAAEAIRAVDADVIYFTGGNSFFLIDQLRKTGTDELLKKELAKGKLMIGESAGAIICAPSIQYIEQMDEKPEDYSQEDDAGLDLIDFYVLPHYLTAPFKKVTEKIMTEFSDLNLCPINNRQGIVIDGEGSKVICKD